MGQAEMTYKPLMPRLLDAGYPSDEVFHHYSDLYVFKNELTERIIREWLEDNGYRPHPFLINEFTDQITGKQMFDVAFQYLPYWRGERDV